MTELMHTPGPWSQREDYRGRLRVLSGRNEIARIFSGHGQRQQNAQLIAAAPELLDALYECAEYLDNLSDVEDGDYGQPMPNKAMSLLTVVERAIAKAEGK
jgi:hypothetical protein